MSLAENFQPVERKTPPGQIDKDELLKMCRRVKSLSDRYGEVLFDEGCGFLVSNDKGMSEIIPSLREAFDKVSPGVGLVIGSGGIFSLLPEMKPIKAVIVVDNDKLVLEFNKFLSKQILSGEGVREIFIAILHSMYSSKDWLNHRPPVEDLLSEREKYGVFHWTNENRLEEVRSALRNIPLVFVAADLRHKSFVAELKRTIFNQSGLGISFANFTNVHEWVLGTPFNGNPFDYTMDYLSVLPWFPNTPILYSKQWLKTNLAIGFQNYVDGTRL